MTALFVILIIGTFAEVIMWLKRAAEGDCTVEYSSGLSATMSVVHTALLVVLVVALALWI